MQPAYGCIHGLCGALGSARTSIEAVSQSVLRYNCSRRRLSDAVTDSVSGLYEHLARTTARLKPDVKKSETFRHDCDKVRRKSDELMDQEGRLISDVKKSAS